MRRHDHISAILILITSLLAMNNVFGLAIAEDENDYAVAVGKNPTKILVNSNTNMIYVANSGDSTISVIDDASNKVVDTINVDTAEIEPSWKGRIKSIVFDKIFDMDINDKTNILYVAKGFCFTILPEGQNYATVLIAINGSSHEIISSTRITYEGDVPVRIAVDSDKNMIYYIQSHPMFCPADQICELSPPQYIYAVNGSNNTVEQYGHLFPHDNAMTIFFDSTSNLLYTAALFQPSITTTVAYDRPLKSFTGTEALPYGGFQAEGNVTGLAFDSTRNKVYAAFASPNTSFLLTVDPVANWTTERIDIAKPSEIAFNPETSRAYIAHPNDNQVSVIDVSIPRISQTITVGNHPVSIAVNPKTNMIYVANEASDSVTIIDGTANMVVPEFGGIVALIVVVVSFLALIASSKYAGFRIQRS